MKLNTSTLSGTATLAALVVVADYTMRYSNLKIPFPWLPHLKFDFTGIPIVISALLFGLIPGTFTSIIASAAILARSGDVFGTSTKGLAELSTMAGIVKGLGLFKRLRTPSSVALGLTLRVVIMMIANLAFIYSGILLLPSAYKEALWVWILVTGAFNVAQGVVSAAGGYIVYEAIKKRAPFLIEKNRRRESSV